ncbi:MAG: hypothetical protein ACK4S0_10345, partial [Sediminibacterium sp.]
MRKRMGLRFMVFCLSLLLASGSFAQSGIEWTPEQLVELFGYCEKPYLIKQLKISEANADKIGQINHWARLT